MTWLLWTAVAWGGETWWVADETRAAELEEALAATWPEREIDVVIGARPDGVVGTTWDGKLLVSYGEDGVRHADVDDPAVAALLARSWALPAAPTRPERYLPEEPPPLVVSAPEVEPVERERSRYRLETGIGTRGVTGQPRPAEGLRLVNELARKGVYLQNELFLGMSLRWASDAFVDRPEEGAAFTATMDRASVGFAVGLRRAMGPVSARVQVGPELRWVEEWLFFRGTAWEFAPHQAFGAKLGAGLDWDIGRFVIAPAAFVRVGSFEPVVDAGGTLDLRFQWRR